MMKFFRRTLFFVFLLFIASVIFMYWGSAAVHSPNEYAEIIQYSQASEPSDSSFCVITYNIGYLSGMTNNTGQTRVKEVFQANMDHVQKVFKKYQPDFLALQEVDFGAKRSFGVNQMDALAKGLGFTHAAKAVNWDKRYVPFPYFPPSQHFGEVLSGQAVLSKYPIRIHDRIALERAEIPFWKDIFYLERLAQIATIQVNGQDVIIINVHLEAFDWETRKKQSEAVLYLYRSYAKLYPTILLGDFNSEPPVSKYPKSIKNASNSEKMASLSKVETEPSINVFLKAPKLVSACPEGEFNKKGSLTYPSDSPTEQIDYIFYNRDQFEMLSWGVINEVNSASDHLPVYMKFKLK